MAPIPNLIVIELEVTDSDQPVRPVAEVIREILDARIAGIVEARVARYDSVTGLSAVPIGMAYTP